MRAQQSDPNLQHPTQLVTVKRDTYSISGLATHQLGASAFKHGIAMFPGHPGILKLKEEGGTFSYEQRGNFLVRSRRHWLDNETMVMIVDAPSDEWASFSQRFRESARYGADIGALLAEAGRRFGVQEWTLVGTSEGSVSAYHAARMNPQLARRAILTASVFQVSRNGPGLSGVKLEALPAQSLWVHHEDDPCEFTSYREARRFAERSGKPLVTVRGGGPEKGGRCEAYSHHGFVGMELAAIRAMQAWVKTGTVPPDVGPQ